MQAPKIDRPPVTTTTDHSELNDATHSVTDTEVEIFTSWINESCADSPEVAGRLPLDPKSRQLFSACKDSWLLVALIDNARPGLVEKSKMHMHGSIKSLNAFELAENANVVIDAARKLGIVVVNIGAEDITGGNQHLILGIIWQIVRGVLSKNLYVVMNPRILRLQKAGESFENLLRVTPEDTLLRWVNQTLSSRRSELKGQYRLVRNFGKDLQVSRRRHRRHCCVGRRHRRSSSSTVFVVATWLRRRRLSLVVVVCRSSSSH
ncbi:calponin homology domain-containing protein [Geranomyces variabilis]|nr:calponin homology domain-containing protein [Geranomyces variabilis]